MEESYSYKKKCSKCGDFFDIEDIIMDMCYSCADSYTDYDPEDFEPLNSDDLGYLY